MSFGRLSIHSDISTKVLFSSLLKHITGEKPLEPTCCCRITYTSTLNACGRGEEWQKALEIFAEAERKGTLTSFWGWVLAIKNAVVQWLWVDVPC